MARHPCPPLALALSLALAWGVAPLPASAADPVEGLWQTVPDAQKRVGRVRIAPCGGALCGTLVAAMDTSGRALPSDRIGTPILTGMRVAGPGRYEGGRIFSPDHGRDFAAHMSLAGNELTVSGCVSVICRTQVWRRIR